MLSWEAAVERGRKLHRAMRADEDEATKILGHASQSEFKTTKDLTDNGWVKHGNGMKSYTNLSTEIEEELIEKLKLVLSAVNNTVWTWKPPNVSSKAYMKCGNFDSYYDVKQKIIYSYDSQSPTDYQRRHPQAITKGELPQLKHWSDVNYLEWADQTDQAEGSPKNLDFVCRMQIGNEVTRRIVWEAFKKAVENGSKGKDETFLMTEETGQAILGTPNGWGVAYLLINHKDPSQLGLKEIVSVRAFHIPKTEFTNKFEDWARNSNAKIHLVFAIRDVKS